MKLVREPPILVTGIHRSGSSFVGQALSRPPSVERVFEPFNPQIGMRGIRTWYLHLESGSPAEERVAPLVRRLLAGRPVFGRPRLPARNVLKRTAVRLFGNLQNLRLLRARLDPRVRRLLLKDPIASLASEWLHRRFGMDVVVLIRHPAAFVASVKRLGWRFDLRQLLRQERLARRYVAPYLGSRDPTRLSATEEAAVLWCCVHSPLFRYLDRNPAMIAVRHEDLSRAPVVQFQALYGRLDLPFGPRVAHWIERRTAAGNPSVPEDNRAHQLRRDSRALVHRWRRSLTDREIEIVRRETEIPARRFYGRADW